MAKVKHPVWLFSQLAVKEYYRLRGWDEETGRPLPETLTSQGLDDLIPAFE
jgi:aldehyde:ferredoxin oxidoreductase